MKIKTTATYLILSTKEIVDINYHVINSSFKSVFKGDLILLSTSTRFTCITSATKL